MWSNGNSFNGSDDGQPPGAADRSMEPWFTSGLLRPWQDRGNI